MKHHKTLRRGFSVLLSLMLCLTLLPTVALAEGSTPDPTSISVTVSNCTNGTATVEEPDQWYAGTNGFSVISKLPCVVIVERSNNTVERLYCGKIDADTGNYRFLVNAADGDKIFVAVKGDVNLDGVVTRVERKYGYGENYMWTQYTLYTKNADGTLTSEVSDVNAYSSNNDDVNKLSAYLDKIGNIKLDTLQF